MIRIGVLGGGSAATLHAEAILACQTTKLIGVGGRPGTGEALAVAAGVPRVSLAEMAQCADAVVIAAHPGATCDVLRALDGQVRATLVESPVPSALPNALLTNAMVGAANLLHAPIVKQARRRIAAMQPHHIEIRSRHRRPSWTTNTNHVGPALDPGARLATAALAISGRVATGARVDDLAQNEIPDSDIGARPDRYQRLLITLDNDTVITIECVWTNTGLATDLEVADERSVVRLGLYPTPELEINGSLVESSGRSHPIEALGFVEQIRRLALVAAGRAEPWPPAGSLAAITAMIEQATSSRL